MEGVGAQIFGLSASWFCPAERIPRLLGVSDSVAEEHTLLQDFLHVLTCFGRGKFGYEANPYICRAYTVETP